MQTGTSMIGELTATAKRLARLLLSIGENRLELLMVAMQEERGLFLRAILLALGISAFGVLAGMTITVAIAILEWSWSPVGILAILAAIYAVAGLYLFYRLNRLLNGLQPLFASLDQLRKDQKALEEDVS